MAHPLRQLVTMSTVGLLFVGGVAAAATGSSPLSPLLGANADAGPTTTTLPTTTTTGSTTTTIVAGDTDPTAAKTVEEICAAFANHGEAVSTVAKDASTVGAEHGAAVSAMAKSDCGKNDDEEEIEAPSEPTTTVTVVTPKTAEEICAAFANHGEAVSAVAKDKSTVGAEHGAAVSAMAQSDCGKTDGSNASDDDDEEERDAPAAANKSTKTHGHHNDDGDNDDDTQGS